MKKSLVSPIMVMLLVACQAKLMTATAIQITAEQLQAVLTAVLTELDRCRAYGSSGELPMVIIEPSPDGPSASFTCKNSADTNYSVSISSSEGKAVPTNPFKTEQADREWKCFHGYVLYEETSKHPNNRKIVRKSQQWQTQDWVVSIYASYDYGYPHYTAQEFSEAVYAFGVDQGLFPGGNCP